MKINHIVQESYQTCPECGGPAFSNLLLAEKKDACYNKVRSRYKVWPSAYASGALVQCRKKGAANWGNKSKNESVTEDQTLAEEFDIIENTINYIAEFNNVDAEVIWEDLESLSDDELYVFAVTTPIMEDWQKVNKKDRTDGMSRKAVKAYRREHPGSKLKTAVTTKPSKLKRGSKASKRRSSYCSRSRGQMKMHSISCAKTPDKAICKARRRWNCESIDFNLTEGTDPQTEALIRKYYEQIAAQGDDSLDYLNDRAPLFAQFWDQYEGDLDSIIVELSPKNLVRIAAELKRVAGELQGVAEDHEQDPVAAFLARGGQIQRGKLHKPRKAEKWQGSAHIGAAGGKGSKGTVSGLGANTNPKSGKPVVTAEDQGVAEGLPQTLRKVVPGYAKREIDKKMDAGKFGKTDADKDANFQRYKKIQDKLKEQGVAEAVTLDRSKNPNYPNDPATVKHRLDTAKAILSNPNSDSDSRRAAAAIIAKLEKGVAEGDYNIRRDPTYQKYDPETHTMMYKDGKHKLIKHDQVAKARALGWKVRSSLKAFAKGQGGVAEGLESYPEVLYHGSTQEIKGPLTPRQAHDIGGAPGSNKNAIYATDDPNFAIAYSLAERGSDTGTFGWKKDPHLIFFGGKIRHGENAYIHVLPTRDAQGRPLFVRGAADAEWHSVPGVKAITPIKIEVKPVDQYLHLLRKPTPEELKIFQANQAKDKAQKQGVAEGNKKPEPPEADYGDEYQAMVARVKKLAGLGPLKTVYDPQKRVYRNMPTAQQPPKK